MTPVLFISYTLMDEKEAEARPVMGTIFLVMEHARLISIAKLNTK